MVHKVVKTLHCPSEKTEESVDSKGHPKRCPPPKVEKRILDKFGIDIDARNIKRLDKNLKRKRKEAY